MWSESNVSEARLSEWALMVVAMKDNEQCLRDYFFLKYGQPKTMSNSII